VLLKFFIAIMLHVVHSLSEKYSTAGEAGHILGLGGRGPYVVHPCNKPITASILVFQPLRQLCTFLHSLRLLRTFTCILCVRCMCRVEGKPSCLTGYHSLQTAEKIFQLMSSSVIHCTRSFRGGLRHVQLNVNPT